MLFSLPCTASRTAEPTSNVMVALGHTPAVRISSTFASGFGERFQVGVLLIAFVRQISIARFEQSATPVSWMYTVPP